MDLSTPQARMMDLQHKINRTKQQLENIEEGNDHNGVRRMALQGFLTSLEVQLERERSKEDQQQYERNMKFLDDSEPDKEGQQQHERDLKFLDDSEPDSLTATEVSRPQTSHTTTKHGTGYMPYAGTSHNTFAGGLATATSSSWNFGSLEDSAPTPNTPAFPYVDEHSASASNSSPDSGFLRPQKRQRESFGVSNDVTGRTAKSMRTTPSPAVTGMTTPTSLGSFEFPEDPELFSLFGGDPKDHMRELREAKAEEKLLEAKRKQEREDEEFARSLVAQGDEFVPSEEDYGPGSSTASRSTFQTTFNDQGHLNNSYQLSSSPLPIREDPFSPSLLPIKRENGYHNTGMQLPVKKESDYHNTGTHLPVKHESTYQPQSSRFSTTDYINLCSDDEYDQSNTIASNPSSDLVEIDSQAFNSGVNHMQGYIPQSSYNAYGNVGGNNNSDNWGYSTDRFGSNIVNAARGMYNSAVDLVNNQISSYGNAPMGFGGNPVYDSSGLGISSNYMGLDYFDQPPQNLAQNVFGRHGIDAQDPANRALVDQYISRVDYVTNDPTRTAAEIKTLLENIRPDEELPPENREGTPEAMKYSLMEHQKLGLSWMKSMEEGSNKGGILADDMGLGKTIQALALMVSRKSDDRLRKTTLIVCPVGLLRQWEREISQKLKPSHQLRTYVLHGEKRSVTWDKLRSFDVVLTTFGTLGTEYKRREDIDLKKRGNPNWRPTSKQDHLPLLGEDSKWYRVIIDEAQCIKNKNTNAAMGAVLLQAVYRFCMTGTPMQNNINELYSLINFLRIKPYCESQKFRHDFSNPLKGHSEGLKKTAMKKLQAMLKAILLRRTKKSKIDGKPILNLPERSTEARHADFSQDEHEFYQALQTRTQLQFNKFLKAGTIGKHYSNILVLLLRLRQACCHPHLIKDFSQASAALDVSPEDMMKLARELASDVVVRIKELSLSNDDCALECPVCMDMTDNSTIFSPCGHNTCSECFARISDPSQAVADGVAEGRTSVKCPNCRGSVNPAKVMDHNAFKRVHMPEKIRDALEEEAPGDVETSDSSDSDSDNGEDGEVDSKGNIKGFVVEDGVVDDQSETEGEQGDGYRPGKTPFEKSRKIKKLNKGKGKAMEKPPKKTLAQLKKEGSHNLKARRRYLKRLQKDWIPSAKTEKTMEILRAIQERKDPETKQCEKTIIFSQFTSLLDLLEVPIAHEGWEYARYDGSMSANARNEAVMEFSDKRSCKILLVSLKAGNSGLNLIAASQVIMLDPFWNPYIEEQAIDRAHRIGQQKPVRVHRIIVENTVEDRILALQEKKRELIEAALDENASKSISRLGVRELGFLFDVPT